MGEMFEEMYKCTRGITEIVIARLCHIFSVHQTWRLAENWFPRVQ